MHYDISVFLMSKGGTWLTLWFWRLCVCSLFLLSDRCVVAYWGCLPMYIEDIKFFSILSVSNHHHLMCRKVHAQRKFAQGCSSTSTPNSTPSKKAANSPHSLLDRVPKTEDFLTFLCLRGLPSDVVFSTAVETLIFMYTYHVFILLLSWSLFLRLWFQQPCA